MFKFSSCLFLHCGYDTMVNSPLALIGYSVMCLMQSQAKEIVRLKNQFSTSSLITTFVEAKGV
jgi:hypothetical protein